MAERIRFDYSKLRGLIVEKFKTITKFSEVSGIRSEQFTDAFKGDRTFTQTEIAVICEKLEIDDTEIKKYFFTT